MTRREIERIAAAVKALAIEEQNVTKKGLHISAARVSQVVGRAVLGHGASVDAWKKWLRATGWPPVVVDDMAAIEAERGKEKS